MWIDGVSANEGFRGCGTRCGVRGSGLWTCIGDESGYSLVEVAVAMTVLTLAVLPIVGMLEAGLGAANAGGRYDAARALANAKIEEARALPYSRPGGASDSAVERYAPPGPPDGAEGPFSHTIRTEFVEAGLGEPAPSATGQMRLDVTVRWEDGRYTATGFVSGKPP